MVRITLLDVTDPPVWRRVLVPAAFTLDRVHRVIQAAMGWQNYHMHAFRAGELSYGQTYPACTTGEGACPPEDSGGFPGYQRLKEILADPSSEEYEEMRTWAESQTCGEFDPARFDRAEASARLSAQR